MTEAEKTQMIFEKDLEHVLEADIVFMVLVGRVPDEGACVELGIAYANDKRCYGFKTDARSVEIDMDLNPMISGCFTRLFSDHDGEILIEELKQYLSENELFIEEVGEKAYRIDRMLQQLYQNGLFNRVDGILIGEMTDNQDDETCTVDQIQKEYAHLAGKPCITGVPSGHGKYNMFLPFGVMAEMNANKNGSASLTFLESALK